MRYFIELSYNGKEYHGWQIQPNAISVQEVVEKALSVVLKKDMSIVGAGRTDAGVHAKQIFAHFDYRVHEEAHARFHATARSYVYRISTKKDAFNTDFAYYFKPELDVAAMNLAAKHLIGFKDFQCFSKSNTDVFTYNCDLRVAEWEIIENEIHFHITADRFLRNMVRAIVGTLINVGIGKLKPEDVLTILDSKNRAEAGYSVPAHGLYLTKVVYPETINNYE